MKTFPSFTRAIVRRPATCLGRGETTAELGSPDHDLARKQLELYSQALEQAGLQVQTLPALPDHPDGHFVEDTAVVTEKLAVISRPGALSRRGEEDHMVPHLAAWRPLARIEEPGTLDGGDVLRVGDHFLVGLSERTNREGARQLGAILQAHGYTWEAMKVGAGLHLKSSVNQIGPDRLLITPEFVDHPALAPFDCLVVPEGEEYACNTLLLGEILLTPAGYPRTLALLQGGSFPVVVLDTSEFRKMDGGLTCLSLRF